MNRWTLTDVADHMAKFKKPPVKEFDECEEPESTLQSECEKWLKDRGYPYLHDRSRKKNPPGMFLDLHIYLPEGRHVVCELKVKGNRLSKEQKDTYLKLLYLGHEVYEVRSFKQFLKIMAGKC